MANKYKNERQQSGSKAKYFAIGTGFIAFILAVVIVWACGSEGFVQNNPLKFFNSWGTAVRTEGNFSGSDLGANGFIVTPEESRGVLRLSARAVDTADYQDGKSRYYLTAIISPANASNTDIDYTVDFIDASGWAEGKNAEDYVSVSGENDKVVVTNRGAFGSKIRIRATSCDNPAIYADCVCDYVKRIENIVINNLLNFPSSAISYECEYSPYTVDADVELNFGDKLTLTDGFKSAISGYEPNLSWGSEYNFKDCEMTVDYTSNLMTLKYSTIYGCFFEFMGSDRFDDWTSEDYDNQYASFERAFYKAVNEYNDTQATFNFTYSTVYNDVKYSLGENVASVKFNSESIRVPVTGFTFNIDHIVM